MAQKSFAWTYRMLMRYYEPDPDRSELALRTILRLLSGPDPPGTEENLSLQRKAGELIERKENKPKERHSPGTD